MAELLYLETSSRKEYSKSTQVANAFLDRYRQTHPDDTVRAVNLFDADVPPIDGYAINAKYAMMSKQEFTPEERRAWDKVEQLIADFKSADKYLLSVPMWNFSIPYRLKQYVDNLVQPGYTFKPVGAGYEGLVKDKPLLVVYARGGAYSEGTGKEHLDFQKTYVELIFGFIGFKNIQSVIVEPTLQAGPEQIQQAVESAMEKARSLAETY